VNVEASASDQGTPEREALLASLAAEAAEEENV
jgi:hypothetical protein